MDGYVEKFNAAMDDDLNTAEAMGALFEMVYEINTALNEESSKAAVTYALDKLTTLCSVLGLLAKESDALPEEVAALAEKRAQARKDKDWKLSDELRDAIKALGYAVEDTAKGQKVRKQA